MSPEERLMLFSILLVECSARPRPARALEWTCVALAGVLPGVGGRQRATRTLGAFQQRGAPFRKREAVLAALQHLRASDAPTLDRATVARRWNGPSAGQGRPLSYIRALALAEGHTALLLTDQR